MLSPVKEICTNLYGLNQNLKNEHLWSPYKYHSYSRTRSPPNFCLFPPILLSNLLPYLLTYLLDCIYITIP